MKFTNTKKKFVPYSITIEVENQNDQDLLLALAITNVTIPDALKWQKDIPKHYTKAFQDSLKKQVLD